jgi:hypothetical protein
MATRAFLLKNGCAIEFASGDAIREGRESESQQQRPDWQTAVNEVTIQKSDGE